MMSMRMPHATENPVRKVRSLFLRIEDHISVKISRMAYLPVSVMDSMMPSLR